MTASVEEILGKAADRLNVAVESLDKLGKIMRKSALDTFHESRDGGSMSFYSPAKKSANRRKLQEQFYRVDDNTLVDYKPAFKSATDFLSSMAKDPEGFSRRLGESVKGIGSPIAKSLGMNTLNPESAGITVLPEFAPSILEHNWQNDLWNRCDVYQVSGNSMMFPKSGRTSRANGSRNGGIQGYWRGEGNLATDSKASLTSTQLRLNDLCIAVYITQELLDDNSYALEQWVARKVAEELNFQRGLAIIRGDGSGKPLGILNSGALVTVSGESGQVASVNATNIVKMWSRRLGSSDVSSNNLVWLINQDVEPSLFSLAVPISTAGGALVYMPPGGLSGAPYATLMGRPVIPSEFCSTVGTPGDIILADLSQYLGIEKGGIIEETSAHVQFLRRELCFLFTIRMDGRPIDDAPLTPYQGSNTQSPFVTLGTRSG